MQHNCTLVKSLVFASDRYGITLQEYLYLAVTDALDYLSDVMVG
jgi:hypothetical protein